MDFTYDNENRLVKASGARNANIIYDPLGRLWEINQGGSATTTRFLYDGDALIAEYDGLGNMTNRYVHGGGVDQPLLWYQGNGTDAASQRGLFANWQGSITAVTDATGNAIGVNGYDAYGIPNETNIGRFQYTGQIWLPELGLYYYKARVYSPTLGRFLQTDPIGYEDQYNLYAYVGNDPVNFVDPTGLSDLNLVREGDVWHDIGDRFEPNNEVPNIFTISAHGGVDDDGNSFVLDQRDGKKRLDAKGVYDAAVESGYEQGVIVLTACNCGGLASELAELTGSTVYAAGGYATAVKSESLEGDTVTLRTTKKRRNYSHEQQGKWYGFQADGGVHLIGDSVNYNSEHGIFFRFSDPNPLGNR